MAAAKHRPRRARGKTDCPVAREQILGKYWELANLDPEVTKGTITGQLKALDSLCQELAMEEADDTQEGSQQAQQIYRSAWLRETVGAESSQGRSAAAASPRPAAARARAKAADDE